MIDESLFRSGPRLPGGPSRTPSSWRAVGLIAALATFASAALVGAAFCLERAEAGRRARQVRPGPSSGPSRMRFYRPGIRRPTTRPASRATLRDDEEILGVIAGSRARAYRLRAFFNMEAHIVNDLLDGRAVTVTYCDRADCARACTGGGGGEPLDVSQGGLFGGKMVIQVGSTAYFQETGEPLVAEFQDPGGDAGRGFPYRAVPLRRTTWGRWKAEHPDTDVYEGIPPVGEAGR